MATEKKSKSVVNDKDKPKSKKKQKNQGPKSGLETV